MAGVPDKPMPILVLEPSRELKFKGHFSHDIYKIERLHYVID